MIKIFLAEDEISIRENIRNSVDWRAAGFEYVGDAPDGEIAIDAIRRLKPDILLTDIKMPFMDGLELTRIVRCELPDVRILILSGYDDFSYAQKAIRLGVSEYLLKPVGPSELIEALHKIAAGLEKKEPSEERGEEKLDAFIRDFIAGAAPESEFVKCLTRVLEFMQYGSLDDVKHFAGETKRSAADIPTHQAYIGILITAARALREMGAEPQEVVPELWRLGDAALPIDSPDQLEEAAAAICERVILHRQKHHANHHQLLITKAQQFIGQNYQNPALSLRMAADEVQLSPRHFSAVFSRVTQQTFSDYLSSIRMKAAMRLLKTTALAAAEISEKIGFNDPLYFSRAFKRATGMNIREFRNKK
jgi:two-component system response regulator YesN